MKKLNVLWLSDHPLIPSGVGIQAKYVIELLLKTGNYKFTCLGGAIKHPDYNPQVIAPEEFGDDWIIHPVDGHGNKAIIRKFLLDQENKPDIIVLFTDPRFFYWVWEIEDEIRSVAPILYWHVWDNDPVPEFNRMIYESNDHIMALSLKTYGMLQGLNLEKDKYSYVPHALPENLFKPLGEFEISQAKKNYYGPYADREFIVMWNNRNARRKMTGDVMESFSLFANKVGHDKVALLMHTSATDQEGQDIHAVAKKLGIENILLLSEGRVPPEQLNLMYNCSDAVINISSNEGFGLGTLEALFAGVPIVVNMTGGLQFQIGNWYEGINDFSNQDNLKNYAVSRKMSHKWFGVPVYPVARNLVGSQNGVPYIYDDRVSNKDVAKALETLYKMSKEKRKTIGLEGRKWAVENFNMQKMKNGWINGINLAIKNFNKKENIHTTEI